MDLGAHEVGFVGITCDHIALVFRKERPDTFCVSSRAAPWLTFGRILRRWQIEDQLG